MVTKYKIIKHTKILLTLLVFHFILITFIKFQLWQDMWLRFLNNQFVNLWKDIYLIFIYLLILIYCFKTKSYKKINENRKLYITFIILLIISFVVSVLNWNWIKTLIIWFKYDIWILFPLFFYSCISFTKKEKEEFYKKLINLIKITIILSIIFAVIRFLSPKILFLLWYWPLWDWSANKASPMYFDTWIYWIQRLSWIFSWPNHMAFYFVAFWPIILLSVFYKKLNYIWLILYLMLLFWTLSRSWIIAFFWEIALLWLILRKYYKNLRKYILYLFFLFLFVLTALIWYLFITWKYNQVILRWASTSWHIKRSLNTVSKIKSRPIIWHWLWTAWPSAHYVKNDIIPESWFLQIFYELWFLWWFVRFLLIFIVISMLFKKTNFSYAYQSKEDIFKISLLIGIIWLLIQGIVLHSFEDAMISLPLFIFIWILLSN